MKIFSSMVYYDAKWVPTGKEGTEMKEGTVVASQYGKSVECTLDGGTKYYIPLRNELSCLTGTYFKGFKWIEIGRIGRRADNKFHDEDVKDSTVRTYRVSELIY